MTIDPLSPAPMMGNGRTAWDTAMVRWRTAEEEYYRYLDEIETPADVLSEEKTSFLAMMDAPAPDRAALRWKLEYLLAADCMDNTRTWSAREVRGTLADIARLLGDA